VRCRSRALVVSLALLAAGCGERFGGLGENEALVDATTDSRADDDGIDSSVPIDAIPDAPPWVRDGTYPKPLSLKGVWLTQGPSAEALIAAGVGRVGLAIRWSDWEPSVLTPPCVLGQVAYDGHCFALDAKVDAQIEKFTRANVIVTAVIYATPPWANALRIKGCKEAVQPIFCAPDDPKDFARFAGMLAQRYSDRHLASDDHGRISDWLIWTYPTHASVFDVGDPPGPPGATPKREYWLDTFTKLYLATHQAITSKASGVRTYTFLPPDLRDDGLFEKPQRLSDATILDALGAVKAPYRVAVVPSAVDVNFGPEDSATTMSFGHIGRFSAAVRKRLASDPDRARVLVVEGGFDSSGRQVVRGTSLVGPFAQNEAMCRAYREVVSTPGIDGWLYYQHADLPSEVAAGYSFGLLDVSYAARPSWTRFSTMDRPSTLECGFEALPYVVLRQRFDGGRHWSTTRMAAIGFVETTAETGFRLSRERLAATHEVHECFDPSRARHYPSLDASCEGNVMMGSLGYAWDGAGGERVELFRCTRPGDLDAMLMAKLGCDTGYAKDLSLGWVLPKP